MNAPRGPAPPACVFVSPLATWFSGPRALARFRRTRLGRAPVVLCPRDRGWRSIVPDFDTVISMAAAGIPFQVAAERRYDRSGDPRRLRGALASGATIYLPQVHQVLPRLMRLMVALRVEVLGRRLEQRSFLFAVEGRGRVGMGPHHDGPVDAFWLQLEGRRTVTLGPPVAPGTPSELPASASRRHGWRTLDLEPGTLFHLPPWTPHDVVCRAHSLALSLTWRTPTARGRTQRRQFRVGLPAWDIASGRVDAVPGVSRKRLWTQTPTLAGSERGAAFVLTTPEGAVTLPAAVRPLTRRLAPMPSFPRPTCRREQATLAVLLEHGIVGPQDLPLRIIPDDPRALDGWRFA